MSALEFLNENKGQEFTNGALARQVGEKPAALRTQLDELVESGQVESREEQRGAVTVVYYFVPEAVTKAAKAAKAPKAKAAKPAKKTKTPKAKAEKAPAVDTDTALLAMAREKVLPLLGGLPAKTSTLAKKMSLEPAQMAAILEVLVTAGDAEKAPAKGGETKWKVVAKAESEPEPEAEEPLTLAALLSAIAEAKAVNLELDANIQALNAARAAGFVQKRVLKLTKAGKSLVAQAEAAVAAAPKAKAAKPAKKTKTLKTKAEKAPKAKAEPHKLTLHGVEFTFNGKPKMPHQCPVVGCDVSAKDLTEAYFKFGFRTPSTTGLTILQSQCKEHRREASKKSAARKRK